VVVAASIAALVECAQTPSPRLMPRWTWLIVILLLPAVGPGAWFLLGRGSREDAARASAPDDDSRFLREIGDELWMRRQRERRRDTPPDGNLPDANPA